MARSELATYLNDHLAGSTTALELLDSLQRARKGTADEATVSQIKADVEADRRELQATMVGMGIDESRTREAAAWLAAKGAQVKLAVDGGALRILEGLEALAVGIHGKWSLWHALIAIASGVQGLKIADLERLLQRAEDQRERVEQLQRSISSRVSRCGSTLRRGSAS